MMADVHLSQPGCIILRFCSMSAKTSHPVMRFNLRMLIVRVFRSVVKRGEMKDIDSHVFVTQAGDCVFMPTEQLCRSDSEVVQICSCGDHHDSVLSVKILRAVSKADNVFSIRHLMARRIFRNWFIRRRLNSLPLRAILGRHSALRRARDVEERPK
jgi:hypothetical protein